MTGSVPYRRGNLREALLARAEDVLRERGAGALSLRELARDIGVSHGAPGRHFADRQQLLDALVVRGFGLLAERVRAAVESAAEPGDQAHRVAHAYVDFAISEANLLDVMYQHEDRRDAEAIGRSAHEAFAPLLELFRHGAHDGAAPTDSAERAATLFLATLQGIAALVNCGVVAQDSLPALIDDAVPRFITSPAGGQSATARVMMS